MDKRECNFWLKEPSSTKATLIYFNIALHDDDVKRSVKRKILPDNWDFAAQRPVKNKDLNKYLDDIEQGIKDLKSDCRRSRTVISADHVNKMLDVILQDISQKKPENAPVGRNMFDDFATLAAGMADGSVLTPDKKKKRYGLATIKQFISISNQLEAFFKEKKLLPAYETVTMETYTDFIAWGHGKKWSTNYIGTIIKRWKVLAKIAKKKGWHTNGVFESDEFVKLTEETDDIFLTEAKIHAIAKANVGLPEYDTARDWFVLDCYLGLRVSDLLRITQEDFEGDFFQFINQKTGAKVTIPINPTVRSIIKRYKGLPPAISDTKLNLHMKEVARKAKLNATFIYTITKGGVTQHIKCKEWEMVSSHTCRRSFITNLLRMGVPPHQVMMLAGIRDYDTLKRYFKQSGIEVAEDVKGHAYFVGNNA